MGKTNITGKAPPPTESFPPLGGAEGAFVRSSTRDGSDCVLSLDFSRTEILGFRPQAKGEMDSIRLSPASDGVLCASLAQAPIELSFAEGSPLESMRLFSCEYKTAGGNGQGWLVFGGTMSLKGNDALLLSFDCLHFYGLELPFDLGGISRMAVGTLAVDPEGSTTREGSLAKEFRLKPRRLLFSKRKLEEEGFEGLEGSFSPPASPSEPGAWAALVCSIAMGKLGELAESAELAAELALGFSPGSSSAFAGVKLPGQDLLSHVGLQGIIGLAPSEVSLQFRKERDWALWVRGIRLSVFGIGLPPGGHVDAMLLGDGSGKGAPAWYCAYT